MLKSKELNIDERLCLRLGPLLDLLLLADDVAVGQPLTDLLERHQVQPVAGGPTLQIKVIPVTKTPLTAEWYYKSNGQNGNQFMS